MTMSAERTEPSAPLDLRTRERGGDSAGVREEVDSRPRDSPAAKSGSEHNTSKLPIRKRPIKTCHGDGEHEDPRTSPTNAKVPRRDSSVRNERKERSVETHPVTHGAHGHGHSQGHLVTRTYYYPYMPHHQYPNVPHLCEDTDRLLTEVALATRQDEDGDTALHIAVAQEKLTVVRWLIHILCRARKNLDLYNNLRQTPLHLAVITHQHDMVESLLQNGADPGALDRNGQNTLHLCCEHSQYGCLTVILSHLAHSQCCPSAFLDSRNYEGLAPLHLTVQDGNKKLAKMLLDSGADINAVDIKSGRSPLVHAVENNCMEMVNFLIENGCNVNAQSYSGNTALHSACGRGDVEAVRVLLKNGADSSLKNYHNDTAVMVAKNKKVSDVLRGKTARGHILKTQQSFNGAASPNNMSHSPLTPLQSASVSPVTQRTHSPLSQSGESMSGNHSPTESQEKEDLQRRPRIIHDMMADNRVDYGMPFHSFPIFSAPRFDPFIPPVLPNPHVYYPAALQRHSFHPDAQFIPLQAGFGRGEPHGQPLTSIATQSRPSSHNSESDVSNTSMNSEGKGIS